ncbi:MAG TPA: hypothetical protein H9898_06835 [Candidatus Anaerobiospirillum stercoravium]|nr:hypothetical protein [Candidatus Anaerobiospirillum stercoravium]
MKPPFSPQLNIDHAAYEAHALLQDELDSPDFEEHRATMIKFFNDEAQGFDLNIPAPRANKVRKLYKAIRATAPETYKQLKPLRSVIGLLSAKNFHGLSDGVKLCLNDQILRRSAPNLGASLCHCFALSIQYQFDDKVVQCLSQFSSSEESLSQCFDAIRQDPEKMRWTVYVAFSYLLLRSYIPDDIWIHLQTIDPSLTKQTDLMWASAHTFVIQHIVSIIADDINTTDEAAP